MKLPNFNEVTTQYLAQSLIDNRCVIESKTSTSYAKIDASVKLIELARLNRNRNMSKAKPDHQLN